MNPGWHFGAKQLVLSSEELCSTRQDTSDNKIRSGDPPTEAVRLRRLTERTIRTAARRRNSVEECIERRSRPVQCLPHSGGLEAQGFKMHGKIAARGSLIS